MRYTPLVVGMMLVAAVADPVGGQAPWPRPEDVGTTHAIVKAAYDAIAHAPGGAPVFDRFLSLFLPQATLISNEEQTKGEFRVYQPGQYVDWIVGIGPLDRGFAEEEIARTEARYGDIAQVFSTYTKRYWDDPTILGSGINAFQLRWHEDRWWIVSIIWDEPTGAGPIPDRYLPPARSP